MKQFCSVLLILASVALSVHAKPSSVQTQLQGAMDKYLVHARDFDANMPMDVTSQCFALYLPMLNEVAATFSSSYQACINTANAVLANLTAQALKEQQTYQEDVSELCGAFTTCDNSTDSDPTTFFSCYANAATNDVSVIYEISTNAANTANTFAVAVRENQDTEYQCTNTTESAYVRDTAATYEMLDSCLKNGVPVTSATTTTEAPTTDASGSTKSDETTVASDVSNSNVADPKAVASIASRHF